MPEYFKLKLDKISYLPTYLKEEQQFKLGISLFKKLFVGYLNINLKILNTTTKLIRYNVIIEDLIGNVIQNNRM